MAWLEKQTPPKPFFLYFAPIAVHEKINGSVRGGKHDVWEGGFRVPMIARWPGHVQAGSTSDQLVGSVDYLATLAAVVGETLPPPAADAAGPDSYDFLSALLGTAKSPIRPQLLLQSSKGVYAIRQGPWKLIASGGGIEGKDRKRRKTPEDPGHAQLFNLKNDPGEQHDVSREHPELVHELTGILDRDRARGYSRK